MRKHKKDYSENKVNGEKTPDTTKSDIFDWIQCIMAALLVCVLVFTFAVRTVGVIGNSMQNTLQWGDRILISDLFYTPERGDIVVLRKETFREEPIVKRIIAVEGQTVNIDFETATVYVDGVALDEPYTKEYGSYTYYDPQDFEDEITVPEGCVFVMGDNRNASTDSRTATIGCVDTRYILGKALLRLTPLSEFGVLD